MNSFFSSAESWSHVFSRSAGQGVSSAVSRDHPEPLLVGEDRVAELVPSLVEQMHVADLVDPLRRRVVRRMRPARRVVDEERLLGRQRVQLLHVADRLVRHGGDQVEALLGLVRIDLRRVAEEVARRPLARVAAHEAVEIVEAHAGRPLVERPRHGDLEARRVVVLAEPGGVVAVVAQDGGDRRLVLGDDAVIAGEARRLLGDHAEAGGVVVAPGHQRRPRRRAQRRRVHVGVAQAHLGDAVERGRRDHAAEGRGRAEAHVVGHDQQDVGRVRRRHDARRPEPGRFDRVALDLAAERHARRRKLQAVDRDRGVRRAGRPADGLPRGRQGQRSA